MFRDNPFLIRELRQHERYCRSFRAVAAFVAALLALPVLIIVLLHLTGAQAWWGHNIWPTRFVHLFSCCAAGVYGSWRVYSAEQRSHTLEAVLLLPYRPFPWLAAKLAFPVSLCATVVGLGMPVYLMAILVGIEPMSRLPVLTGQAGVAALAGLCVPLLFPPLVPDTPVAPGQEKTVLLPALRREATKGALLIVGVAFFFLTRAGRALHVGATTLLFGVPVPLWPLWLGMAGLGLAAVLFTAATPLGSEQFERRAYHLRLTACLACYWLGIGALWQRLPGVAGFILLLLPGLAWAVPARWVPLQFSDPWSAAELRWIAARTQNPVLLLDYRLHSRRTSMRRAALYGLLSGVLLLLFARAIEGSWRGAMRLLFTSGGYGLWSIFFASVGAQAATRWQQECNSQALSSLLLSPMSSRELMKGRMSAAFMHGIGRQFGVGIALLTPLLILVPDLVVRLIPAGIGLFPTLITNNLLVAFSFKQNGMPDPEVSEGERDGYFTAWLLLGAAVAGCIVTGFAGFFRSSWVWWVAGLSLALNVGASCLFYHLKLRRLEAIRQAEFLEG